MQNSPSKFNRIYFSFLSFKFIQLRFFPQLSLIFFFKMENISLIGFKKKIKIYWRKKLTIWTINHSI